MARYADDTAPTAADIGYDNSSSNLDSTTVKDALDELDGEKSDITRTANAQTGTSYTFALTDAGNLVTGANASAITWTVPPNSSVAFEAGTQIDLLQEGAGQITLAEGAGVTINSKDGNLKLTGQYSAATLIKTATDTWTLFGDLSA